MKNALKILLVEDDEDDLFLTRRILKKAGLTEVFHVVDGRLAIDYLGGRGPFGNRLVHPLPDVVFVDLKIPEINGHQVVEWVAAQRELAELKTYILSSSGEERDRRRAQAAGATGYFVKPLTPPDIERVFAELQQAGENGRDRARDVDTPELGLGKHVSSHRPVDTLL